ncbi:histidine phosphatase family protein [Streptomyces sp. S07_1.15]|uniref:histidine phosphatase family protein n=1 Tax=Streptomyces sp. S07_1.15 TaxID=2873925 RepID=UPI001D149CA1|nr:histidine phosphatase family protein [Streptomyces sp. S07_1.15]MCC3650692.1 histidine phosphatase family protein [Streptomyces sp. S07_1.15]
MTAAQRFVLVRHAEASLNVLRDDDVLPGFDPHAGLTPLGERQARALADHLPRDPAVGPPDRGPGAAVRVYSSPQRRAARTAEVLGAALGVPVVADARLAELRAPEAFPRPLVVREWDAVLEDRLRHPAAEVRGVESWVAQRRRIGEFLAACCPAGGDGARWVLVSHSETMQALLFELLGLDDALLRRTRFKISNTGVFIVDRTEDGCASLVVANSKAHLARTA